MGWNPIRDLENGVESVGGGLGNVATNAWSYLSADPNAPKGGGQSQMGMPTPPEMLPTGGGYPAMANDYGLGQGTPQQPQAFAGSAAGPDYLQKPLTLNIDNSSSRGFNPWSTVGESNARGRS